MSLNSDFRSMPIQSATNMGNQSNEGDEDPVLWILMQACLIELVSLVVICSEVWNELFGGSILGIFRPLVFQQLCQFVLLFAFPFLLICCRFSIVPNKRQCGNVDKQLFLYSSIHLLALAKALSLGALGSSVGLEPIGAVLTTFIMGMFYLLIMLNCCVTSKGHFFRSLSWKGVSYFVFTLMVILSLALFAVKGTYQVAGVFMVALWCFFRLWSILEAADLRSRDMSDTSATTCGSMKMIDKSTLPALAISTLYLDIYCILLLEFCMCNLFSFCCVDAVIKVRGSKAYYPHIFAHMRYDEHIDKTSEDSDFEKGDMEHLLETDDENGNLESDSGGEDSGEPDILDADEKTEDLSSYVEVGEKLKTTNGIDHKDVPQVDSSVKIDLTGVVKITEEADDELSTSLNQEREINRSFDLFMSRHDDNETLSEYAKLLRGLYEYCISFGHRDNTFTALCWRNFNAELKKHEKRKKLKKKDKKKKDDRRVRSLYPGIQELDLIFTDVNKKGLSQFDSFLLAWQTLSAATFFAEKKSTSEITFVYDFGLPLSLKLGTILTEKEARERSLERIMKSDVMKLLFTNNRGILKSMFIHYSIEDEAYVPNDSVHMTLTAWFSFFTDMNISVNKSEVLELRQIYEQTVNAGGGGVNEMSFGSFKSALLRVACHLDRNLRTVKRGGIKAGEAVRALKVMFHSMESEGGLKVASRKGAKIMTGFSLR
jgi:hypothetical protein